MKRASSGLTTLLGISAKQRSCGPLTTGNWDLSGATSFWGFFCIFKGIVHVRTCAHCRDVLSMFNFAQTYTHTSNVGKCFSPGLMPTSCGSTVVPPPLPFPRDLVKFRDSQDCLS